ncbi:MAG: elongation factor G [Planctomycetota bacterium]|jgi:elongation factor G
MPNYTTADIRNILVAGSAGSGKTTLVESMLHQAGVIGRPGRVEDGNTVCDYDELEREFQHSLAGSVVHFDHDGAHVNVIDTPGAPDYLGSTISALPAVEVVAVVVDASAGIETVTRRVMLRAEEANLPRMIIVNKVDNAPQLGQLIESLQETFGTACRPINLPGDGGTAVVDCFQNTDGSSDLGDVADFHTGVVEQVVEIDEALMERYFEQGDVGTDELREPFKQALREGHLVPICFTSARNEVGVKELLEIVSGLCPSPVDGNPRTFQHRENDAWTEWTPDASSDKSALAHVFKVSSDPFVGKLCVFRVHQGHIGSDVQPLIDDGKKGVRIAHVFSLQGKDQKEVDKIIAGDIGAVAKVEEIDYNSVMHVGDVGAELRIKPTMLPKPMFGLAIEGTSKGAETKMSDALRKLVAEDPTLEVERVQATHETVLRGLGEQHLRVKLRMLKDRYSVEVDTHPPKVAYKETITKLAEGHHRHKKQTGGAGQFGEVFLRVEPLNGDEEGVVNGLLFVDDTFGGSIPKQFLPAIEKGIRQVMIDGAIAGFPMQNIKVSVYDGKHHPVDSKEVAFMTAGKKAFIDGVQKAGPVLLEPFVKLEITVPADQIGDISSDIAGRRGRIQATEMLPGNQAVVTAEAPLSEVMAYSSQLKSMTGGAGSYSMEYSHDERTPPNIQAEVVKSFKPREDED